MTSPLRDLSRQLIGTKSDWRINAPTFSMSARGVNQVGPLLILVSAGVAWVPMSGARGGEGPVSFGPDSRFPLAAR